MATVSIDIPGIGTVEAENAASESTLRELVNLIRAGGGGAGGGGGGGTSAQAKSTKQLTTFQEKAKKEFDGLSKAAGIVSRGFVELGQNAVSLVNDFAKVGDSLEAAAGVFNKVPIVGDMFSAVASAASSAADSLVAGAASGATFDGSIRTFSRSASQAGMTLDQFGSFLASNGAALVALGGETSTGAKRFSMISQEIRRSGQDLFALGYSTRDINEGFANYAKQLRMQGLSSRMSNADLVKGSKEYLKEMDALAKITGEERKAKEAERERLLKDAQFQASMIGLNKDVRDSFLNTVQQLPEGLQSFSKDILAAGTATTEENQKLLAFLPQSAALLNQYREKMQRGEALTIEERNRLNNLMLEEGAKNMQQIKTAGIYSAEFAGVTNSMIDTQKLQRDSILNTANSQSEAQAQTDAFNKSVQESKAALASFSNEFMVALADSGILPVLMDAFTTFAGIVMDYVVPIFQEFGGLIMGIIGTFLIFKGIMLAINVVSGTLAAMKALEATAIGGLLATLAAAMIPVLVALAPFVLIGAAVAGVAYAFHKLGGDLDIMKSALNIWWEGFKGFFNLMKLGFFELLDFIPGLDFSEEIASVKADIEANANAVRDNVKFIKERSAENREKQKAEDKAEGDVWKNLQKAKKIETKSLETANKKLDKERQKNVDYNTADTVSLLGDELKRQGSSLSPKEQSRKDIETKAEEKERVKKETTKQEEGKKESAGKTSTEVATMSDTSGGGNQKTATDLLAALNTKLDALLRVSGAQLQVQRSLSGDLFA